MSAPQNLEQTLIITPGISGPQGVPGSGIINVSGTGYVHATSTVVDPIAVNFGGDVSVSPPSAGVAQMIVDAISGPSPIPVSASTVQFTSSIGVEINQKQAASGSGQSMTFRSQAAGSGSTSGGGMYFITGKPSGTYAGGNVWVWGRETALGGNTTNGNFFTDMLLLETTPETCTLSFGAASNQTPLVGAEIAAGCILSISTENNSPVLLAPSNGTGNGQAFFYFTQDSNNGPHLSFTNFSGTMPAAMGGMLSLPWETSSTAQEIIDQRNFNNTGDLSILSRQSGVLTHGSLSEAQNFWGAGVINYQIGGAGSGHAFTGPNGPIASLGLDSAKSWVQGDSFAPQFDSWTASLYHADTVSSTAQSIATIPLSAGTLTYGLTHLKVTIEGLNESTGDFATFSHRWAFNLSGGVIALPTGSQPAAVDDGHSLGAGTSISPTFSTSGSNVLVYVTPWTTSGVHWTVRAEKNLNAGQRPNPTTPPGSPIFWWRADLQGLGSISSMTDQSGNGHNLALSNGTNPSSVTSSSGPTLALPSLVFTGASSAYTIANAFIGAKNFTIAFVFKVPSLSGGPVILSAGNINADGWSVFPISTRTFDPPGLGNVTDGAGTTNWESWIFSCDSSGNLTLLVNGASQSLSPSNVTTNAPSQFFTVGATVLNTGQFTGNLFEVIVYSAQQNSSSIYTYVHAITGL